MSEGRLAVRYVEILGHALFFWAYVLFFGFWYIVIIYIMDSREFNGTFWLSISAMLLSFVGILTVFCLKSKCKKCNICYGLISVERDIDGELEDEKMMIENGMDPYNIEHKN
jgi:hypothetical protein